MKGESGEEVQRMIWMIFLFGAAVLAILVFVLYLVSSGQTECWRNTLSELRPITGTFEVQTLGVGNLLGKEKFNVGVTLRSACVDRIIFDDLKACRVACGGTEGFEGDEKTCLEQCSYCVGSKGCIIAVPRTPESITEVFEGPLDYIRSTRANVKVFNSIKYGFSPQELISPETGAQITCMEFTKAGEDAYSIRIVKKNAKSIEECDPTGLGFE